ncbi:MAG: GerMN domain-containing protein [Candidatus Acidiferrales bacterium]
MPRNLKLTLGILAVAVLIGLISLGSLERHMKRLSQTPSEERARRDVLRPRISTSTDVRVSAKVFWAAGPDKIAPVEVDLALSADPVQRAKQVLHELITDPPTPDQRTLPADASVLAFYVLPDGTAIADFSDALASETPSGILSEQMAVNSIAQTLENNVPALKRLKILIHGQEVETLAGHVDLTGFFDLTPPVPGTAAAAVARSAFIANGTFASTPSSPTASTADAAAQVKARASGAQSLR